MTLIVALIGRESIWIMGDRRLNVRGKPISDDAVKLMSLERDSDNALLGYSGLGLTPAKRQPSEWMNAVLRGRNDPLERSLEILGGAIGRQIPKYLLNVPNLGNQAHVVLAPAFFAEKPTLYSLELDLHQATKSHRIRVHRHETTEGRRRHARIGISGSGTKFLIGQRARLIGVLRLIKKHEEKR